MGEKGGEPLAYISLYRKWRPQGFGDVVGQETIVKTLENSLNSGRISHAYLFTGPRGTGKTTVARILAKGLNCQTGPTAAPCGVCEECLTVTAGTSLNVIEIDGASNRGIDDVRELRNQVQFTPINAKYKVYIIDEVHMLTTEAFNALLKTLEEPPPHVIFIFATTDPHRLPPTILSRVQRYDFQRFTVGDVVYRLETVTQGEGFKAERRALELIAQHAGGGMRDALSILEKCAAFSETITSNDVVEVLGIAPQEQIETFTEYLLEGKKAEALQIIDSLYNQGRDLSQFALGVVVELRRGILAESGQDNDRQLTAIELLQDTVREMRFAPDPRISLELIALKIASDVTSSSVGSAEIAKLEEKVRMLERQIEKLLSQGRISASIEPTEKSKVLSPPLRTVSANDIERSASILEAWPEFLQALRSERLMQCEAFLKEGSPVGVSEDSVVVSFPRDRGFHKASIEQDTHREPAERVLSKLIGMNFRLKCIFQDEAPAKQGKKETQSQKTVPSKPSVPQNDAKMGVSEKVESPDKPLQTGELDPQQFIEMSLETFGGKIFTKPKEK